MSTGVSTPAGSSSDTHDCMVPLNGIVFATASSNVSLSGCFLYTMWMQCRNRRHHIFWMLFQDGLIYGFGVIISNVAVTFMVLTMRSLAFWHAHMYAIDSMADTVAKLQGNNAEGFEDSRSEYTQ
ncbi:hypothetical protein THASP1DRAFT_26798 [Thamnocephalis sphaerospora]|uniref:Uncharacterized protein n=1 Tax=Thamnocephalis sphaerospora TaxID=78915 RepID=A0A4P9XG63_9FUNG|nr:hypothetical protein THASP1DRAFT_26798 [Thamnocephalis sphaerospora]|eukprot:RKP04606.1 hypothetical protein THASP1DRAFT_26798 [Thamnocephalis sphaerospora]